MQDRIEFFATEKWTAGVIGLGYVGLPLAVAAVSAGLHAIGYDADAEKVDELMSGISHVGDVSDEQLRSALDNGLVLTADPSKLSKADTLFICVPSPLGRNREPDMSYIKRAAATVADAVHTGSLVSLESTTYPGTTEEILVPAATRGGLVLDEDVFVAFSPERVSPGDDLKTPEIPKVVGGVSARSTQVAAAAYRRIVSQVHVVSSARAAELTKLLENTYRAVNIALVNEMAQLANELEVDIWEVVDAAATKPFGFQAFYPGPGVGGHCISLDPQFLAWRAKEARVATRFIDTAEQVNQAMPRYVADRAADILNDAGLPVRGSRILGVGIAYKPNVSDDRESASIDVLEILSGRGATVSVFDPLISTERIESHGFHSVGATEIGDDFADLAIVLTDHSAVDYAGLAAAVPTVFDTRGIYRRLGLDLLNVQTL